MLLLAVAVTTSVPAVLGASTLAFRERVCPGGMSPRLQKHDTGTLELTESVTAAAVSGPRLCTSNERPE